MKEITYVSQLKKKKKCTFMDGIRQEKEPGPESGG